MTTPMYRKLLREGLHGDPRGPLAEAEVRAIAASVTSRLEGVEGVTTRPPTSHSRGWAGVLEISVKDDERAWYRDGACLALGTEATGRLMVCGPSWDRSTAVPFTTVDDVVAMVLACRAKLDQVRAGEKRREKVRGFKAQAIVAAVRTLAEEEGLEFFASADTRKLLLHVTLGDSGDLLEIEIPFAGFQEVLPKLRATILAVRELRGNGIRFGMLRRTSLRRHGIQWTNSPEK